MSAAFQEPILVTAVDAARLCGRSVASWRKDDQRGICPAPVRVGGSVRWRLEELRRWIAAGCPVREVWEQLSEKDAALCAS